MNSDDWLFIYQDYFCVVNMLSVEWQKRCGIKGLWEYNLVDKVLNHISLRHNEKLVVAGAPFIKMDEI